MRRMRRTSSLLFLVKHADVWGSRCSAAEMVGPIEEHSSRSLEQTQFSTGRHSSGTRGGRRENAGTQPVLTIRSPSSALEAMVPQPDVSRRQTSSILVNTTPQASTRRAFMSYQKDDAALVLVMIAGASENTHLLARQSSWLSRPHAPDVSVVDPLRAQDH